MIKNSDTTPDWILSNENIKTIVSNLSDFGVAERKLSLVRSLLRDYISDENPLPYADHRYPTRSKVKDPKEHVSYFGKLQHPLQETRDQERGPFLMKKFRHPQKR